MGNISKKFTGIYDRYVDKIYRFIFFKVDSREIAEDLASETFLRGWREFRNNRDIENPPAFLYKIARNLVTDYYRTKGKIQFLSNESILFSDPRTNLEEESFLNSDLKLIKKTLLQLKSDYQNVIIWHYLDDLPIAEVSKLLGRSEEATRMLLSRALKELKKQLEVA